MLIRPGLVAALLLSAHPASAQIFSWRDGNGNLVLSNRSQGQAVGDKSYEIPQADHLRSTRYVAPSLTRQFDNLIFEHASTQGIRTDLVRAVIQVESGFNPFAKSPKGALGLMQLMPATIKQFRVVNPFSPKENIRAGVAYLRELLDRYSNNETLALAAYNAGPGAVDKHGQRIPPYPETQNYVSRVGAIAGPAAKIAGTNIYRIVQIMNGRERVLFSTDPQATINPAALPPSDPAARTPAQVLQSSPVFQAR
jgi:soluble lytic murein transglycosylase-like protein